MNKSKLMKFAKRYGTGVALCCLGAALMISPDSASALVGTVLGWVLLLLGAWVISASARERSFTFPRAVTVVACLWGAITLMRNPLEVASAVGRVAGILLLVKGCQDLMSSKLSGGRALSVFTVVLGFVLLALPLTTSRLLFTGVGVLLIVCGVAKIIAARKDSDDDSIIDAL